MSKLYKEMQIYAKHAEGLNVFCNDPLTCHKKKRQPYQYSQCSIEPIFKGLVESERQVHSQLDNWGGGGYYSYIHVHRP